MIFTDGFPTEDGRGHFVPADYIEANEWPDEDYPFVFITGRHLEHWHTGSMTRRATVLDALEPEPVISIHPEDLNQIGALPGDMIRIDSRRGASKDALDPIPACSAIRCSWPSATPRPPPTS